MGKGAALKVPAPSVAASILPPRKGEAFDAGIASKDSYFLNGHDVDLSYLPDFEDDFLSEAGPEAQTMLFDSIVGASGAFGDFDSAALFTEQTPAFTTSGNPGPPLGALFADSLFTHATRNAPLTAADLLPPSVPVSPLAGAAAASPWTSPLRAPGSPACTPGSSPRFAAQQRSGSMSLPGKQAPVVRAVNPAAGPDVVSVLGRALVATSFASTGAEEVRLVYSRAPKRKAEPEPVYESEDSDNSVLTADAFTETMVAPSYGSSSEVEAAFKDMATQQATPDGEIVTISPTLWRGQSPPFRLHASVGLHSSRAATAEAPVTWYGTMNPRVITTGQPKRSATRGAAQRRAEAFAEPPVTRSSRGGSRATKVAKVEVEDLPAATAHRDLALQEVWLLQRGERGEVLGAHRATGPFTSTTIAGKDAPTWTGDNWSVDVAALVLAPTGDSFWLRAAGRAVQEQDA